MPEHARHHELLTPLRELSQQALAFVMDKIVPTETINHLLTGEVANRTAELFQPPVEK